MSSQLRIRKNKLKIWVVTALSILAFVVQPMGGILSDAVANALGGETRYVAIDGDNRHNCKDQTNPCKTISKAIQNANSGDTIIIAAGTYTENITVNKSLTITGVAGAEVNGQIKIETGASDVTLSNFSLRNNSLPAVKVPSGVSLNSLTLQNMNIDSFKAIYIGDGSGTLGSFSLTNSTVTSNYPVYIDHPTSTATITGNTFNIGDLNRGVVFANQASTSSVSISGNTFNATASADASAVNFVKYEPANSTLLNTIQSSNTFNANNTTTVTMLSSDGKAIVVNPNPVTPDTQAPTGEIVLNNEYNPTSLKIEATDNVGVSGYAMTLWNSDGVKIGTNKGNYGINTHNFTPITPFNKDMTNELVKPATLGSPKVDITILPDGQYKVMLSLYDEAKNQKNGIVKYFTIDHTAPVVSNVKLDKITPFGGVNYTGAVYNSGKLKVTFDTNEKLRGDSEIGLYIPTFAGPPSTGWTGLTLLSSNNGIYTYEAQIDLTNRTDTSNVNYTPDFFKGKTFSNVNLYFRMVDTLGNKDSNYYLKDGSLGKSGTRYAFTIDNKNPTNVGATSPADGSYIHSTNNKLVVTGTATDDSVMNRVGVQLVKPGVSGDIQYVYANGNHMYGTNPGTWSAEFSTQGLADGKYGINVYATDLIGNTTVTKSFFTLDNSAPIVTITSNATNNILRGVASFNITVNGDNFDDAQMKHIPIVFSKGNNWDVRTKSNGTIDLSSGSATFTVDTKSNGEMNQPFADAIVPVAAFTNPAWTTDFVNGYQLKIGHFTDLAGNAATVDHTQNSVSGGGMASNGPQDMFFRWFGLDNTAPTIKIDGANPDDKIYGVIAPLNAHVTDNDGFTSISLDRDAASDNHWNYTGNGEGSQYFGLSWLRDGKYTLTATDKAGNVTTAKFTVDRTKPKQTHVINGGTTTNGVLYNPQSIDTTVTDDQNTRGDAQTGVATTTVNIYSKATGKIIAGGNHPADGSTIHVALNNLDDGEYYIKTNGKDGAGNTSNTDTINFVVDNSRPDLSVTTPTSSNDWQYVSKNSSPISVKGSVDTAVSGTQAFGISIGTYDATNTTNQWGHWVAGCSNLQKVGTADTFDFNCEVKLANLNNGKYLIRTTVQDNAGHWNAINRYFIVDNTAPTISVSDYKGDLGSKTFREVSFKLHDDGLIDRAELNGKPFTSNHGSPWGDLNNVWVNKWWSGAKEGNNTLVLFDMAGNSVSYDFTIDATAPTITNFELKDLVNGQYNPSKVIAHASDGETFVTSVSIDTYKLVNGVWTYTYSPFVQGTPMGNERNFAEFNASNPRINQDGTYKLVAWATDKAGNVGEHAESNPFTVDNTTPAISNVKLNNATPSQMFSEMDQHFDYDQLDVINGKNVPFEATINDNGSGIASVYNAKIRKLLPAGNTDSNVYSNSFTFSRQGSSDTWVGTIDTTASDSKGHELADGTYQIVFNVKDKAGNVSVQYVDVLVDNTAPSTPIANPNGSAKYDTAQKVELTTDDNDATIYYTTDGTDPTDASDTYTHPIDVKINGTILKAIAYDKAGNASSVGSWVYTIAPALTIKPITAGTNTKPTITGTTNGKSVTVNGNKATVSNGTWTYKPSKPFPVGTTTLTVVSTDENSNTTTQTAVVTVKAAVVKKTTKKNTQRTTAQARATAAPTVTITPATAQTFGNVSTPTNTPRNSAAAVKGDSTKSNDSKAEVKGESTEAKNDTDKDKGCYTIFGICWYWWIPVVIVVAAIIWRILAGRNRDEQTA